MRFSLVAALLLLGVHGRADDRAQKYYYEDITQPFFALDPQRPGWYHSQRPGSLDSGFSVVKSSNTFRVFVIGGSIASLLNQGHTGGIVDALEQVLPGKNVEVLNCGMAGYETNREALIEQEILEYSPDLIVFLTGHNEGIASAPIPIWVMHAQDRLAKFGAFRALVRKLHPNDSSTALRDDARSDARDATFAKNLAANLRHARERGVETAVVVPPRNYREPVELGRIPYDAEFLPGWLAFLRGDYAVARQDWKDSLKVPPGKKDLLSAQLAFTWGFIGRAEEKLGLWDDARVSFETAARHDRAAICGAICQDIIREVTKKEGGFLVEGDKMFRALAAPRMPGMETFNDRMHWKPAFNCLMSSEIIAASRVQPKLASLPWDQKKIDALKASCVKPGGPGDKDDDLRILSYVLMGLSWPNFGRLSTVSVFYLEALHKNRPAWFKDVPALMRKTQNPQTLSYGVTMAPEAVILPRFYWHIGEVLLLGKDYSGAIAHFKKALELEPKLPWASLSLGVAQALNGDKKSAVESLKNAVGLAAGTNDRDDVSASAVVAGKMLGLGGGDDVAGSDPEFWIKKAEAAMKAENRPEGVAALDRVMTLSPAPYQVRLVGQYYRMLHAQDKFLDMAGALTKLFPDDADTWLSIAEDALLAGRRQQGVDALDHAEKLTLSAQQAKLVADWRKRLQRGAIPAPAR